MLADEIKAGETANIEFKVEVPKKSEKYIKSVVAFANTSGGKIIIGIDDKTHEVIGVNENEVFKIIDNITNAISDMCYPQIFPNIEINTLEGKCIIVVEIYPSANRPYYIKSLGKENGTYIRVSGTSRPADSAILKDLELQGLNRSFDEIICVEQKYNAEDAEKLCSDIKNHIIKMARTKNEKENIREITVQNLVNWGVLKNIDRTLMPTNAFVLLTSNIFPFAKIQCALFKGTERVVFIDKRDFDGPLYEQIEAAYEFVLKHINLGAEIKGLLRTDSYELPPEAIREAIVNATTHRNFLDNSCVQVAVYDDRVEITSPGMLFGGLTIPQIKEGGSKIRNRCIAEVFNRMKIVESWGTGIRRMFNACKEYGVREPELLEIGDSFRVNLYRPSYNMANQSSSKSSLISSPKSSSIQLNESQKKIIDMIDSNSKVTQEQIANEIQISKRAVQKNIKELVDKGIVKRFGSSRNGYWEIL